MVEVVFGRLHVRAHPGCTIWSTDLSFESVKEYYYPIIFSDAKNVMLRALGPENECFEVQGLLTAEFRVWYCHKNILLVYSDRLMHASYWTILSLVRFAWFLQIFDLSFLEALLLPYIIDAQPFFCADWSSWSCTPTSEFRLLRDVKNFYFLMVCGGQLGVKE